MPLRKIRAKKYSGIYEYFKAKDNDKVTIAYYFQYRDAEGNPKKPKLKAMSKDEALVEANAIKEKVRRQKNYYNKTLKSFKIKRKAKNLL